MRSRARGGGPARANRRRPYRIRAPTTPHMGLPVTLHVYDLGRGQLKAVGTHWAGAFHSAVEVNDREWSFGATDQGSGVFSNAPRGCTMHT